MLHKIVYRLTILLSFLSPGLLLSPGLVLSTGLVAISTSAAANPPINIMRPATTVEWIDLLPEEDLRLLESIPQIDHQSMSDEELALDASPTGFDSSAFENQIAQAISEAKQNLEDKSSTERNWRDALKSTKVRPEFDNKRIRIAGYIVPITYNEQQIVTEFFLVPYYGACIHVPPPPPNQLIHIQHPKGFRLQDLYTPFWVDGIVKLETNENELGLSSYAMHNVSLSIYEEAEELEYLN